MKAIEAPLKKTDWPALLRKVRLGTGFVLFFYVTTHLLNLMLGLISVWGYGRWWSAAACACHGATAG
jgi:hypothetical protein